VWAGRVTGLRFNGLPGDGLGPYRDLYELASCSAADIGHHVLFLMGSAADGERRASSLRGSRVAAQHVHDGKRPERVLLFLAQVAALAGRSWAQTLPGERLLTAERARRARRHGLERLSETLLTFVDRCNQAATPLGWEYTADDLAGLLRRISEHEKTAATCQIGLAASGLTPRGTYRGQGTVDSSPTARRISNGHSLSSWPNASPTQRPVPGGIQTFMLAAEPHTVLTGSGTSAVSPARRM